jgi:hypothetical protein
MDTQSLGSYYIYPAQPRNISMDSTPPWVPPDNQIYASNSPYPAVPLTLSNCCRFDGASIASLAVSPLQYCPLSQHLVLISSITFQFSLASGGIVEQGPALRGEEEQMVYDQTIRAMVENPDQVSAYYTRPPIVPEESLSPQILHNPPQDVRAPAPFTIITTDSFKPAFQRYADSLTARGVAAKVVTLSDVYSFMPPGLDSADVLRSYIKYGYLHDGTAFVLLGGDDEIVPVRYCWGQDGWPPASEFNHSDSVFPADLYFEDMSSLTWDADGDHRWGEPNDDLHDSLFYHFNYACDQGVFVGRVPCHWKSWVDHWVDKEISYEFHGMVYSVQYNTCTWYYDNGAGLPLPSSFGRFPSNYSGNQETLDACRDACNAAAHLCGGSEGMMNLGGMVTLYTHGSTRGFACCTPPDESEPYAVYAHMDTPENRDSANLKFSWNTRRYNVVVDVGCGEAGYDNFRTTSMEEPSDTTLMEGLLDAYDTVGSVAFIGDVRSDWPNEVDMINNFYDRFFKKGPYTLTRMAPCLVGAKTEEDDLRWWYNWNFFGSPNLEPWVSTPKTPVVDYYPQSPPLDTFTFGACSDQGESMLVCVYKPGEFWQVARTGIDGSATFKLRATSPGVMTLCVWKEREDDLSGNPKQYMPVLFHISVGGGQPDAHGIQGETDSLPKEFVLQHRTPNPSSRGVAVRFGVPTAGSIRFTLWDATGRLLTTTRRTVCSPGYYMQVMENGARPLPAGPYFVSASFGSKTLTSKYVVTE